MKKLAIIFAVITIIFGCQKADILQLNTTHVKMFSLDEHFITSNGTNVRFTSQNPFIATVNETTGCVAALHIGKTKIHVTSDQGDAYVDIIVQPLYNVITDPTIEWGISQTRLEAYLGTPYDKGDDTMTYLYGNENYGDSHIATGYMFERGGLSSIIVIINNNKMLDAVKHLAERYQFYINKDNSYLFGNALDPNEITTTVMLTKESGRWIIVYMPA